MRHKKRNKTNPMIELLIAEDKKLSAPRGPKGVLVKLWRQILLDENVTPLKFNALMNDFIVDERNGVAENRRYQTQLRGNLMKEFCIPKMSWPVFLKGLRFMKFRRVRFVVQAQHEDGRWTESSTSMDFGDPADLKNFLAHLDEEDKQDDDKSD